MPNNFSQEEEKILKFWNDNKIFEKSLEQTKDKKPFVFYDGPPFATGTPHYGHLLQSAIKDAIPRYKTMQGFYVARQWGWDCHGLPIENIVEKNLGTKSKKDIVEMGVKKFNDLCRDQIFTFINEWEKIIPRLGRWVDMENPYRTMDFGYMQSEWWAFKELYKKGLIYEGHRSMHICPRCETTLSQGEVAEGYKDIKDLSATLKFKVKNPEKHGLPENTYFLAWTTTPWTLPGNVALAVGEKIKYDVVQKENNNYILAQERIEDVLKEDAKIIKNILGKDLVGIEYEPLFDNYAKNSDLKNKENGWKVYSADFVNTEDGTGIVHIAPAFGTDDMNLGKEKNLPFVQHVKMDGTFKDEMENFVGLDLKPRAKNKPEEIRESDLAINKFLDGKGLLFNYEKYEHSYPHCWRCDTALLNYATSSWFVAVEKIKPQLLKTAKKINWVPEHIKEGRFGQWLAGARDWSISRQRFWANTIPVWRCDKCENQEVFGSAQELEKFSKVLVDDLHKEVVDQIKFDCSCGGEMQRIPDVLDTWFDSGSMPFATLHYPAENKDNLKKRLPADFIAEAQDQTRAWFYYLNVLSGALFGSEAFKNCIVTGIVLAEDGKKMAKKLKNYPDPAMIIEKYGADALRFHLLSSPVVQAENLSFSEKGVDEVSKKNIGRIQNVLAFFKLYESDVAANNSSKNILDKWIISRLEELLETSTKGYEDYKIDVATRTITDFIDDFSVWYLRRSRDRFKEETEDKKMALATMRYVLYKFSQIIAPAMPFLAEYIFQTVREKNDAESVHLTSWPKQNKNLFDKFLTEKMKEARSIVNLSLAERITNGIKVKQPLSLVKIKNDNAKIAKEKELLELIKDEINVKEIIFDSSIKKDIELDIDITEELKAEGIARETVRAVQAERKNQNLVPQDRISVELFLPESERKIVEKNKEFFMKEFRATEIILKEQGEQKIKIKKV